MSKPLPTTERTPPHPPTLTGFSWVRTYDGENVRWILRLGRRSYVWGTFAALESTGFTDARAFAAHNLRYARYRLRKAASEARPAQG